MYLPKTRTRVFTLVTMGLLTLLLTGCDTNDGPVEKAGENVDQAIDSVQNSAEDLADKVDPDGPAEQAGEKIDETIEQVKEAVH